MQFFVANSVLTCTHVNLTGAQTHVAIHLELRQFAVCMIVCGRVCMDTVVVCRWYELSLKSIINSRAVVLTTHSMEEADAICSKIGIMIKGNLRAQASFSLCPYSLLHLL